MYVYNTHIRAITHFPPENQGCWIIQQHHGAYLISQYTLPNLHPEKVQILNSLSLTLEVINQ